MENLKRITHNAKRTTSMAILFILACLFLPLAAQAATYYLDAGVSSSGDGTSWAQAKKTWAEIDALLDALPNDGAGDTVEVNTGNYGDITGGVLNKARTDWLTIKTATGKTPVFTSLIIHPGSPTDVYLIFDGINVEAANPGYNSNDPPWTQISLVAFYNANYIQVKNNVIKGWSKYLSSNAVYADNCNDITFNHCEIHDATHGMSLYNCPNFTVTGCYIHDVIGSGIRPNGGCDGMLIENTHITKLTYSWADDFYPSEILDINNVTYPGHGAWDDPDLVPGDIIYQDSPTHQAARVRAIKFESTRYRIYAVMTVGSSELWNVGSGKTVVCQRSGKSYNVTAFSGGHHGGSAIAVRTSNITIKKNIINNWAGQGIMNYLALYGETIENNLLYDVDSGHDFSVIDGEFIFRNNTVVGFQRDTDTLGRYDTWAGFSFASGYTGYTEDNYKIYNNIMVGRYTFPAVAITYGCGNNIVYSSFAPTYGRGIKGESTSLIGLWKIDTVLHGYPNLFEDIGYTGSTAEYNYAVDGIRPFFVNPGFRTNLNFPLYIQDHDKVWDYHLAAGSPGINFGDPDNQPIDSLGTIGPDGFIRDDGPTRDADHHSAGCYEYGATAFLYGDLSGEGEVTAYDAALTAQAAVKLITLTPEQAKAADVSGEGEVTAYDAALIAQKAVGLIEKFPVE